MDKKANPAGMNLPAWKPQTDDEIAVYNLYQQLLKSWNDQNADNYGQLFTETASVVGFDGSQMNGNKEITEALRAIFANHKTNWYVSKVRELQFLTTEVALLRAVAGMYSPAKPEINPQTNAIQSMIAVKKGGAWKIALFQNTPAQFHGRPDLSDAMLQELQSELE